MLRAILQRMRLKRVIIPLGILALLMVSWFSGYLPVFIVMMYESVTPVVPPERPENVPATAVWAGGRDGGDFIDCVDFPDSSGCFDCVVYSDFVGWIEMKGIFCLDEGKISIDSLRKVYGCYNGYWISLEDGRQLAPVVHPDSIPYEQVEEWNRDR